MLGTAGFTALLCSFAVKAKEEKTEVKEEKSDDNSEKVEDSSGGLNASDIASLLAVAFGAAMSSDEEDGGSSEQLSLIHI